MTIYTRVKVDGPVTMLLVYVSRLYYPTFWEWLAMYFDHNIIPYSLYPLRHVISLSPPSSTLTPGGKGGGGGGPVIGKFWPPTSVKILDEFCAQGEPLVHMSRFNLRKIPIYKADYSGYNYTYN